MSRFLVADSMGSKIRNGDDHYAYERTQSAVLFPPDVSASLQHGLSDASR